MQKCAIIHRCGAIAIFSKFSELRSADYIRQGKPCATLQLTSKTKDLIVNFLLTINLCPTLSLTKKLDRIIILDAEQLFFWRNRDFVFYKNLSFGEAQLEIILQKIFQFVGLGVIPNKRQKEWCKNLIFQIWVSTCPACKVSASNKINVISRLFTVAAVLW